MENRHQKRRQLFLENSKLIFSICSRMGPSIFKVFTVKLPESGRAISKTLKIQVKLILNCPKVPCDWPHG